jgi:single-stranded-DNA-specific exonuclease
MSEAAHHGTGTAPSRMAERAVPREARLRLENAGVAPLLARLWAARGVSEPAEQQLELAQLLAPQTMRGMQAACERLGAAIDAGEPILVVADYDCDGATACAVMLRGLRMMGATIDYLVPNRFEHGYGLTPPIVDLALAHPRLGRPRVLVTVDNGIASLAGVAAAHAQGLDVIVTDHHLPAQELPPACAIVNPNQPGCGFASRDLAGVGVAFYLLLALRAHRRAQGHWKDAPEPALQGLLDLVALGTVADLVRLDRNNRILVAAGLRRIRAGRACAGIRALLQIAKREAASLTTADLGYALGPRVNAAGRMTDITVGIECLLTDDFNRALALAGELDAINQERRSRQTVMHEQALAQLAHRDVSGAASVVLWQDDWHEGIVGLVASRLKDQANRPAFAFAPSATEQGLWRGSGRSIAGVHLRDVLDRVSKREPDLIERFGGHAMAAGLSVRQEHLQPFAQALEQAVREMADPECFETTLATDGMLTDEEIGFATLQTLSAQVWGQGFAEPLFCDVFEVRAQRLVKERHLKLALVRAGGKKELSAIWFEHTQPLAERCRIAYRLARDEWNGPTAVQLLVTAAEPLPLT